jgi:ribosomal protein S18 acetylase RimI-like enzyme
MLKNDIFETCILESEHECLTLHSIYTHLITFVTLVWTPYQPAHPFHHICDFSVNPDQPAHPFYHICDLSVDPDQPAHPFYHICDLSVDPNQPAHQFYHICNISVDPVDPCCLIRICNVLPFG